MRNHVSKSQILWWLQACNQLWQLFGMHGHLLPSWVLLLSFLRLSHYRAWGILISLPFLWSQDPSCDFSSPGYASHSVSFSHSFKFSFLWIQVFVVRERSISQVLFQRADTSKVWSLPPICKNFIVVFIGHYFLLSCYVTGGLWGTSTHLLDLIGISH